MNIRTPAESPGHAWLRSLPLALLLPLSVWIVILMFNDGFPSDAWIPLGFSMVVHSIAYAIFGLPLFFRNYSSPSARIWELRFAIPCGGILGIAGVCLPLFVIYMANPYSSGSIFRSWGLYLVGGVYGVCTGFAAWLERPGPGGANDAAAGANLSAVK